MLVPNLMLNHWMLHDHRSKPLISVAEFTENDAHVAQKTMTYKVPSVQVPIGPEYGVNDACEFEQTKSTCYNLGGFRLFGCHLSAICEAKWMEVEQASNRQPSRLHIRKRNASLLKDTKGCFSQPLVAGYCSFAAPRCWQLPCRSTSASLLCKAYRAAGSSPGTFLMDSSSPDVLVLFKDERNHYHDKSWYIEAHRGREI